MACLSFENLPTGLPFIEHSLGAGDTAECFLCCVILQWPKEPHTPVTSILHVKTVTLKEACCPTHLTEPSFFFLFLLIFSFNVFYLFFFLFGHWIKGDIQ